MLTRDDVLARRRRAHLDARADGDGSACDAHAHADGDLDAHAHAHAHLDRDADSQSGAHADRTAEGARTGRWIEVDVTRFVVRLMDGKQVVREIGPVAVGREVDTGRYESTQTGLFHVYNKTAPRTFDAPYNTYIQWWVGFDPAKDNGFHSFLLDAEGKVMDAGTGRISNGCIRTGEAEAVFQYAEVGMPVFVRA